MSNVSLDIVELEKLCEQLYNATSTQQIHEANKVLENFANSSECLSKCQILLDRGVVSFLYNSCLHNLLSFKKN